MASMKTTRTTSIEIESNNSTVSRPYGAKKEIHFTMVHRGSLGQNHDIRVQVELSNYEATYLLEQLAKAFNRTLSTESVETE